MDKKNLYLEGDSIVTDLPVTTDRHDNLSISSGVACLESHAADPGAVIGCKAGDGPGSLPMAGARALLLSSYFIAGRSNAE